MSHLSEEELIDLAEGARAERDLPPLSVCASCRTRLTGLQAAMSAGAAADAPEPSPLFWEHFSDRVRAAVSAEAAAPVVSRRPSWRFVMPAVALAAVVLVAVVSLRMPSR